MKKMFFSLSSLFLLLFITEIKAELKDSVYLYTPYTKIYASPGDAIDYSIDLYNKTNNTKNINIKVVGLPKDWIYELKSGAWKISQISLLPDGQRNINLKVTVPLQVEKGVYRFRVVAEGFYSLPLAIEVTKKGTYKTDFTCDQPNMEGDSKSTFTFMTKLSNQTNEKQLYSFRSEAPEGWRVTFKVNYKAVTAAEIEAMTTKDVLIEIDPPDMIEAGKYGIPVYASTGNSSASLILEVVITGSYKLDLTTPNGLLSTSITAGKDRRIELQVKNTGTAELAGINLESSTPVNWSVTFEPQKIEKLKPGETAKVIATIKVDKKAIAGDYITKIFARNPAASSEVTFRVTVKTPLIWGWIGIFVIISALGFVYYLFKKYGRR